MNAVIVKLASRREKLATRGRGAGRYKHTAIMGVHRVREAKRNGAPQTRIIQQQRRAGCFVTVANASASKVRGEGARGRNSRLPYRTGAGHSALVHAIGGPWSHASTAVVGLASRRKQNAPTPCHSGQAVCYWPTALRPQGPPTGRCHGSLHLESSQLQGSRAKHRVSFCEHVDVHGERYAAQPGCWARPLQQQVNRAHVVAAGRCRQLAGYPGPVHQRLHGARDGWRVAPWGTPPQQA